MARLAIALLFAASILATGCDVNAEGPRVEVYVAAALQRPLEEAAEAYRARTGVPVAIAPGASSALRLQIEQGAHADVFLSADEVQPAALVDAGLTAGPLVPIASDRLVVIVSRQAAQRITDPFAIAGQGVRLVGAAEGVPVAGYARRLVQRLAALPGAPPDFADRVEANIVSREDDVRSVVSKVEFGEADAAIVYATSAAAADVATVAVPVGAEVRATFAGVVLADAAPAGESRAFLAWLAGGEGAVVLARHGFLPPP